MYIMMYNALCMSYYIIDIYMAKHALENTHKRLIHLQPHSLSVSMILDTIDVDSTMVRPVVSQKNLMKYASFTLKSRQCRVSLKLLFITRCYMYVQIFIIYL